MAADPSRSTRRVLDPMDRLAEALFGLIMVLTFTGSMSAAEVGRDQVRTMLLGAIGCNIAWGLVDAAMYLIARLAEQGRGILTLRKVRESADPGHACGLIADELPPLVVSILAPGELESVRQRLVALPPPPTRPRLRKRDWLGALAVFLWVFLITFPVVIPFIFMRDALPALRVSNLVAVGMLFVIGWSLGKAMAVRPWMMGLVMVVLGGALVGITIALGG